VEVDNFRVGNNRKVKDVRVLFIVKRINLTLKREKLDRFTC